MSILLIIYKYMFNILLLWLALKICLKFKNFLVVNERYTLLREYFDFLGNLEVLWNLNLSNMAIS